MLLLAGLLLAGCAARETTPPAPGPELRYYVKAGEEGGLLRVTLVAENLQSDSLDFTFPVWLPGDFRPIEPGKWVEDVRAYDRATAELPVRRIGPNLWRVYPRRAPYFLVGYTLHPVRPDGFKRSLISELTARGGYFTGTVAFGYLRGLETHPVSLTFELGPGWPAICSLEELGPARYRAANAYELAQSACAYGPRLREDRETVRGVEHRLVLVAPETFDPDSLMEVVEEVAAAQGRVFGSSAYPEYTFFVHFVDPATTGLGGSPLFRGSAYYLPRIEGARVRRSGIPGLLAHQLAHAWTLWLFPPAELDRPPIDRPVSTRGLWFVEGLAEHAARLALSRATVLPRAELYAEIARDLETLADHPDVAGANLETASAAATRGPDRRASEVVALKSPLAALALDVEMRRGSGNVAGADSLVRVLEAEAVAGRAVPYDSIVARAVQLGGPPARALYASAIAGGSPLPARGILAAAGLELVTREVEELNLGAALVADSGGVYRFRNVEPQSIAGRMGLRGGDRLVEVNQLPVSPDNLLPLLAVLADLRSGTRMGKPIRIRVERAGGQVELSGTLQPWTREVGTVVEAASASTSEVAIREGLFSGTRRQAASPPAGAGGT
ncbi:MAG: hypothetical protein ABR599_01810 [Gemmatimonadota bacterium]